MNYPWGGVSFPYKDLLHASDRSKTEVKNRNTLIRLKEGWQKENTEVETNMLKYANVI